VAQSYFESRNTAIIRSLTPIKQWQAMRSLFLLQLLVAVNSLKVKQGIQSKFVKDSLTTSNPRRVGLVIVSDTHHQQVYDAHIKSVKCYAERQQYDMYVIDTESKNCAHPDFFFRKHCLVREFMESKPAGYQIVVLDGDVHVGVLERGLDKWLNDEMDVQLYMRDTMDEIMAGNYMVRNTPLGRKFLEHWSNYNYKKPPGFASDDNGAIHPLVLDLLLQAGSLPEESVPEAKACIHKYHNNLTQMVEAALAPDGDYWDFSKTCMRALGQPRQWKVKTSELAPFGNIAIWPRFSFFVTDFGYMEHWFSKDVGPIMHHGMKDKVQMLDLIWSDIDKCALAEKSQVTAEKLGHQAWNCANGYGQDAERQGKQWFVLGKGCPQCLDDCMATFTCRPLKSCEVPTMDGGKVAGSAPANCPKTA